MRAIVIGAGEVGINVARTLSGDGHEVTLVDNDPARVRALEGDLDALVVEGNGASPRTLREIEAGSAQLLAAVTQIDEVNVIAALAADKLGTKRTVARVRDPDFFDPQDDFARNVLGINFVIDPDRATAHDIAEAIKLPGAVSVEYFGDDRLGLAEVILTAKSPLVGVPLAERDRPEPAYIVGVVHKGKASLARGDDVLAEGDHILVAAGREHLAGAVANFAGSVNRVRDCVIFGGGKISFRLGQLLEDTAVNVTILERDAERARFLAERLPHTTVMHDEGVSREAQATAGVADADAFVACAGDDRANLLATLEAKRLGAGLCLSVVSREEFIPLVDALELDNAFSPRLITAEAILRYVHTESLRAMHLMRSGFEALELEVEEGSRIAGQAIGETHGVLRGCRVGVILRDNEALVPTKGTTIEPGDRLLMLGVDGTLSGIESAFTGGE